MHPLICQIGPVTVYSYGVMMAIAVLVCSMLLIRPARQLGIQADMVFDLSFWIIVSGIIGARIFYILLNLNYFMSYPIEMIKITNGGLAWQGGLAAGLITVLIYSRSLYKKKQITLLQLLDLLAPYIALGQAIGRIGCFLNGCCYGKPVSWGIYFPVHNAHLHPTQLYSSGALILVFFILKNYRRVAKKPGQVFILYLILASIFRFIIEFFRADHGAVIFGLSIFQIICFIILLISLGALKLMLSSKRSKV